MANLNRRDAYSAIPQLEKKISDLGKYISVEDGKLSIRIDNAYGDIAELTIQADQIEGRVENAEGDIGDLQITAQAITQALTTKVTIFTSQPSPPYEFGDLWDKGADGLYRCIRSRSTGAYQSTDWAKEDKTALDEVATRTTMIRSISGGTLTCYEGGSRGVFINANGTVDIVYLTWSGTTPTISRTVAQYGNTITLSPSSTAVVEISGTGYGEGKLDFKLSGNSIGYVYASIGANDRHIISLVGGDEAFLYGGGSQIRVYSTHIEMNQSTTISGNFGAWDCSFSDVSAADITASGKVTAASTIESTSGRFVSTKTYNTPGSQTNANLYVNGNGTFMQIAGSSRRYKYDIEDADRNTFDPHTLYTIPFRQFRYKDGYFGDVSSERLRQGFIAEEVYEAYPPAAVIENGEVETWSDRELIPPMLALIQEQNERIKELERKVS